jgi:hypothetical protein
MDKKFLHKVIDQLVYETEIDYGNDRIRYPYGGLTTTFRGFTIDTYFMVQHLKNIYGLHLNEIEYVISVYKQTIKDKLITYIDDELRNHGL